MGRGLSFLARQSAGYGRRGGTSATAGKQSATYIVHYPGGRSDRKRTFKAIQPWAIAAVYQNGGVWYCAGVYDVLPAKMNSYTRVTAERVG
jgi:hypothetical protein